MAFVIRSDWFYGFPPPKAIRARYLSNSGRNMMRGGAEFPIEGGYTSNLGEAARYAEHTDALTDFQQLRVAAGRTSDSFGKLPGESGLKRVTYRILEEGECDLDGEPNDVEAR